MMDINPTQKPKLSGSHIKHYSLGLIAIWTSLILLLMTSAQFWETDKFADILYKHTGPIEINYGGLWLLGSLVIGIFYIILFYAVRSIKKELQLLYRTDERYTLIERALADGVWDWDIITGKNDCSPYCKEILGYTPDDEMPPFFEMIHPDDHTAFDEAVRAHLEDHKHYELEFRLKHKEGQYRWILSRGEALRDENAKAYRMLGSIKDITRQKESEEKLRMSLKENEAYYKLLFEASIEAIFVVDVDTGEILDVNKQAEKLMGYPRSELIKMNQCDLHPDPKKYKEIFKQHMQEASQSPAMRCAELQLSDGRVIPCEIKAGMVQIGERTIAIGSFNDLRDRLLNEQKIQNSEQKFKSLYDNAPLSYQSLDEEGRFIDINPTWLKTLGYQRDEIINHRYADLLHPDWTPHFEKNFPRFKKQGHVSGIQYKIRHKDGHYLDIEFEGCVARNPDGSFKQTYCVFKDITGRLQAEKELAKGNKLLEDVINAIPDMVWMKDPQGVFLTCNSGFEKLLGATKEQIIGTTDYDHLTKEQADICTGQDKAATKHGRQNIHEEPIYHAGLACEIFMEATKSPVYDDQGQLLGVLGVGRNITEEKHAADALRQSEESLALVMEGSQLGFWDWNIETSEVKRNDRWAEMLDYNPNEIEFTVKQWIDFIHPDDRERANNSIQDHLKGKTPLHLCEYRMQTKNGPYKWILDRAKVVRYDSDGNPIRMGGTHTDITERKETELALKEMNEKLVSAKEKAEQNDQLKTAFLMNLSHEIRTPMNGILGFSGLLKMEDLPLSSQRKYIEVIEKSGQRMLRLIDDLIDISKIEVGLVELESKETDLNQLMDKVYDFFVSQMKEKGLGFSQQKDEGLKTQIIVDDDKLEQILVNLVNNALKFTNKGSIKFNYKVENESLLFCVKDTGSGIPPEMKNLIFERFRQVDNSLQRSEDGIGLGLSICKAYIELMEGQIWVESQLGEGSTFWFRIPLHCSSEVNKLQEDKNNTSIQHENTAILIAEDDEINSKYLYEALRCLNLELIQAYNGKEALKAVSENPDIKLVLMDIKMPLMGGLEATMEIRKNKLNIPIIAQSAHASESDKQRALDAGCNAYLTKPINREELIGKINNLLNEFSS